YVVKRVKFSLGVADPEMPGIRFHNIVFVETDPKTDHGIKFHVIGDITSGMKYESKNYRNPEESLSLHSQEVLGYTDAKSVSGTWDKVLGALPHPYRCSRLEHLTLQLGLLQQDRKQCLQPGRHAQQGVPRQFPVGLRRGPCASRFFTLVSWGSGVGFGWEEDGYLALAIDGMAFCS
ncbi:hypothetical protein C8A05DRAFT_19989, partial [Staphylotrichum tortipilum]